MNRQIDNAYQRIDMAMGLIGLGKAHALLGEALWELHLAIADRNPTGGDVKQAPPQRDESGGAEGNRTTTPTLHPQRKE